VVYFNQNCVLIKLNPHLYQTQKIKTLFAIFDDECFLEKLIFIFFCVTQPKVRQNRIFLSNNVKKDYRVTDAHKVNLKTFKLVLKGEEKSIC
jgi:hypothetical protein